MEHLKSRTEAQIPVPNVGNIGVCTAVLAYHPLCSEFEQVGMRRKLQLDICNITEAHIRCGISGV